MEWKRSLGHCRRFIIIHCGCHFLFVCAVAFLASPTVGGDTKIEQVERNGCHKITELRDLTLALADISDWKNLGYWLSVPHQIIQTIESDEKGTENKRRAVLRVWYNLQDHDPCWQSVTDALRQHDQNRLAARIDQCIHSIQSGSNCNLAICMKNGVDECTHSYNSIITTDAIMTTISVLLALCCCYFNHRSPQQENEVRSAAQHSRGIYTALKENPSLGTQFQVISVHEEKLFKDTRNIQAEFNVLFTIVINFIVRQGVTVDAFVLFLESEPGYGDKSLFEAEMSDLHKAKDLNSVFRIVKNRCSWFNHSFLGNIIKAYCNDNKEIKKCHQDYLNQLHEYCNNRVCSLMNGFQVGSGGKDNQEMIIKVDEKWEEIRIEQLEEVVFNLADVLKVPRHTLQLCTVENGCVQLTLLVPSYIQNEVFPLTTGQEADLRKIGVTDLQCGTYHFPCQPSAVTAESTTSEQMNMSSFGGQESEQLHTFPVNDQSFNHLGESDGSNISGDDVDDLKDVATQNIECETEQKQKQEMFLVPQGSSPEPAFQLTWQRSSTIAIGLKSSC